MFIATETRKQLSLRFTVIAFVILVLLNGLLAFRQTEKTEEKRLTSGRTLCLIYEEYAADPEKIAAYYTELQNYKRSQNKAQKTALAEGREFVETRPSRWTDGLYTDDIDIIRQLQDFGRKLEAYPNEVQIYIRNAQLNQQEFLHTGFTEDSYEVRFQKEAERLYRITADEVELHPVFINGWNDMYSFPITGILCCVFAILLGAVSFTYEKESGMFYLLRCTKKGRAVSSAAKIAASCLISLLVSLVLTAETAGIIAWREGFNGGAEPIQALDAFRKSYLICSVRGYLWSFLGQRLLAAAVFTVFSSLISVLFYNYVLNFIASFTLAGLNLLLYTTGSDIFQVPARYINLYSLMEGTRLYTRYCAANLFEAAVHYSVTCFVLFGTAAGAGAVVTVVLWAHGGTGVQIPLLRRAAAVLKNGMARLRTRAENLWASLGTGRTVSLHSHEMSKIFSRSVLPLILILLCVLSPIVFSRNETFYERKTYTDKLLNLYLEQYRGEWTEEKHGQIEEHTKELREIIGRYSQVVMEQQTGAISNAEYLEFMTEYNNAKRDINATEALYRHSSYLQKQYEETGIRGWFMVDDGWEILFGRTSDWFLFVAAVIAVIRIFTVEYGASPFSVILHSTKKGRKAVFRQKFALTLGLGAVLFLLFEIPEYAVIHQKAGLDAAAAPVFSSELFSDCETALSFRGMAVLYSAVRLCAAETLTLLTVSIAALVRSVIPALTLTATVTLLPAICEFTGIRQAASVDFLRFFEGGRLLFFSLAREDSPDFAFLLTVLALAAVLCTALVLTARHRFCQKS